MLHRLFEDVAGAGVLPVVVYNNPLYTGNNAEPEPDRLADGGRGDHRPQAVDDDLGQLVEACVSQRRPGALSAPESTASSTRRSASGRAGSSRRRRRSCPRRSCELYDRFQAGDHAGALAQHRLLQPLNRFLEYDPGYVSPTKEALEMMGIGCGPVRRPLPDFPESERPALREALAALGALEAVTA